MGACVDAEVVRQYVPFADRAYIHGVTFDGQRVWFSRDGELVAFDAAAGRVVGRLPVPAADAGTTFDGKHLYQLCKGEIVVVDPVDGRIVRRLRAPDEGLASGMAWAEGRLFVGQFRGACIHELDAQTGEIVKTIASDRCVTGVCLVEGELWHAAAYDGKPSELRHVAPDGGVAETWRVPVEVISGIEASGDGGFWCAGEKGTLRLVRRHAAR